MALLRDKSRSAKGGIYMSYVSPHCRLSPFGYYVWRVSGRQGNKENK